MRYLSTGQTAEELGVTRNTIMNWIREGKFPNAIRPVREFRIPMSDVESLKNQPWTPGSPTGPEVQTSETKMA